MSYRSRTLYRRPEDGMIRGVCAGIAHFFGVPAWLIRVIAVIATFSGFFWLTITAYILMSMMLGEAPYDERESGSGSYPGGVNTAEMLDRLERSQSGCEKRIREIERYITSDEYTLHRRFRDLK